MSGARTRRRGRERREPARRTRRERRMVAREDAVETEKSEDMAGDRESIGVPEPTSS